MKHLSKGALSCVVFLFIFPRFSQAQVQGKALLDSLENVANGLKDRDTNKVKLLYIVSYKYSTILPESGLIIGERALELAKKQHWKRGIAAAHNSIGNNYMTMSNYVAAKESFWASYKINKKLGDSYRIAVNYRNLGVVATLEGELPNALEYHFQSMQMYNRAGDSDGVAAENCNIGVVYLDYHLDTVRAWHFFQTAIPICERLGNKRDLATNLNNAALTVLRLGEPDSATKLVHRALKICDEIGDNYGKSVSYKNIGVIYTAKGYYFDARDYLRRSLRIADSIGSENRKQVSYAMMGMNYLAWAKSIVVNQRDSSLRWDQYRLLDSSEYYLSQAVKIANKLNDLAGRLDYSKALSDVFEMMHAESASQINMAEYLYLKQLIYSQQNMDAINKLERELIEMKDH